VHTGHIYRSIGLHSFRTRMQASVTVFRNGALPFSVGLIVQAVPFAIPTIPIYFPDMWIWSPHVCYFSLGTAKICWLLSVKRVCVIIRLSVYGSLPLYTTGQLCKRRNGPPYHISNNVVALRMANY
jgi:hypothetical protein